MNTEPTVLLAALETGEHVQVGRAQRSYSAAHDLFERMDGQITGWTRQDGKLTHAFPSRQHFIDGRAVRFYRLRQVPNEFGTVRKFPLSAVRYTNRKAVSRMTSKTPSGIKRPQSGTFVSWEKARTVARYRNKSNGRGYRALKAADGKGYTVIFRPAVANNKQRKVRAL